MTVPMMPMVGAKPPAFSNDLRGDAVALAHGVVLGLEDVGDEVGVGAVDDELQALLDVRVVDLGDLVVERQQAVAAGLLGVADEQLGALVEVRRRRRLIAFLYSFGIAFIASKLVEAITAPSVPPRRS